jgi:hypothetical protein
MMSLISRAIGPVRPSQAHALSGEGNGMTPYDGRKPTTLQNDAGIRSEPPMSEPSPSGWTRAAIAAATPPDEPPALNDGA